MAKRIDIKGKTYGLLTVKNYSHTKKNGRAVWLCKCECGNKHLAEGALLRKGNIKSCGCLRGSKKISVKQIEKEVLAFTKEFSRTPMAKDMKDKAKFSLQKGHAQKRLGSFKKLIARHNIDTKVGLKHRLNEKYFNKIDSEDKAYFLGLLLTDGTVRIPDVIRGNSKGSKGYQGWTFNLVLHKQDKHILVTFRDAIESEAPIKLRSGKNSQIPRADQYEFRCGSKIAVKRLLELGIVPAKSLKTMFPPQKLLPKSMTRHFIRGIFDGDGGVHKHSGQVQFVSGSRTFIYELEKNLASFKIPHIKVNKRKKDKSIWYELVINAGTGTKDWVRKIDRTGKIKSDPTRINKSNLIRFYQLIYKDSDPKFCLSRKKSAIEKILVNSNHNRFSVDDLLTINPDDQIK